MEQVYIFMLFVFFVLAVLDLAVGVSNDAVNFLNSAVGSKVATIRTIMIVASVGVAFGAIFSSGMMEIARKGIFNPAEFYFDEIMVILMSVMLADVLLLDLFNSLGLPTSTTVSIVFELLGAAVCLAVIKISANDEPISSLEQYINTEQATKIVAGIFTSVVIAFTVGTIVQYLARLVFSFRYEKSIRYIGGIFGGIALTALTYFIIFKGLKGVAFIPKESIKWLDVHILYVLGGCFVFYSVFSHILIQLRVNIFRVIILSGTFALAMAFAGNDLVNFIGVPVAAWQSYNLWQSSGVAHNELIMNGLSQGMTTPAALLLLAGAIMVLTLWFSKKARNVMETEVSLSHQGDGDEKFASNMLSRFIVRITVIISYLVNAIIPKSLIKKIDKRFEKTEEQTGERHEDKPAFDLVRAAMNLVVSSSLIALGTSLKQPLSTTYVTFMVAMGSSLADRAWGRDSAVYRVAGVLNVVGGWFMTAIVAFLGAFLVASVLYYGEVIGLILMILVVGSLLIRSAISYKNKQKAKKNEKQRLFEKGDIITIGGVIKESSNYISEIIGRIDVIYADVITNLATQDLGNLTKNKKTAKKLEKELDALKGNTYYFIKSLNESSVASSKFYIMILDNLQYMAKSLNAITINSYEHVNNNHKNLKFNQIRDLKGISESMGQLFKTEAEIFKGESYSKLNIVLEEGTELKKEVSKKVQKQIDRIRTSETSPKTTKLYFTILLETNALVRANNYMLTQFKEYKQELNKLR